MELPALASFIVVLVLSADTLEISQAIPAAMYGGHYAYRSLVYPFRQRSKRGMPIVPLALGVLFNVANGSVNAYALTTFANHLDAAWIYEPRLWIGTALFSVGLGINLHSDAVLRRLRRPNDSEYAVPNAGLHRWVAAPNYFGELVEWLGFALAAWTLPAWGFLFFTAANLVPRARSHLDWYRDHFEDYPSDRRALIPFVW
jgi:steroid 5-alpha reductase family enzyme